MNNGMHQKDLNPIIHINLLLMLQMHKNLKQDK